MNRTANDVKRDTMHTCKLLWFAIVALLWIVPGSNVHAQTPSGTLSGFVTFEDGTPASGARVVWHSLDATEGFGGNLFGENKVVCAKDGSFKCERLPKGPFRLDVTARPVDCLLYTSPSPRDS